MDDSLLGWAIDPSEITISQRKDGSDWVLGAGTYGKVRVGRPHCSVARWTISRTLGRSNVFSSSQPIGVCPIAVHEPHTLYVCDILCSGRLGSTLLRHSVVVAHRLRGGTKGADRLVHGHLITASSAWCLCAELAGRRCTRACAAACRTWR